MNTFQWVGKTGVVALTLGCLLSLVPLSVSAIATGGIGGRPANPDPNNPRTQSIFIFTAAKGETKKDVVLVSNNSDKKQVIELYAVDGIVTNTGAYTCSQQSEPRQSVGSWITLDKSSVTLGPGKTEEVGFTLAMPQSADVGEHNGCIVFQLAEDEGEATGSVRIRTRQALRVVTTVPGNLHRSVDISSFSFGNQDGGQLYTLNLKNSGNVSADVDAKVYLTSLFGKIIYQNGGGYPIMANQKLDLNFVNEKPPLFGGWFNINAKIFYDSRAGTFGTGSSKNLVTKSGSTQLVFLAPTTVGALILAAFGIVITGSITLLFVRRRLLENTHIDWAEYKVRKGESLQHIADKYNIHWKRLASVNTLTPPYTLLTGQVVRVPPVATESLRVINKRDGTKR